MPYEEEDKDQAEKFVLKVVTVGDGSLYGWAKYNQDGEVVETSDQNWPAAMDAEKAARAIANENQVLEVDKVRNINSDANVNVEVVKPEVREMPGIYGAKPVEEGVVERNTEEEPAEEVMARQEAEQAQDEDPTLPTDDEETL